MTNAADDPICRCAGCGLTLPATPSDEREPCPDCGSTARNYAKTFHATLNTRASLQVRGKEGGKGRPFVSLKAGANWFAETKRWHIIEQLVDRRSNRYKKRIVDEATGEVLRDDDGPLTEHQGYGSARH